MTTSALITPTQLDAMLSREPVVVLDGRDPKSYANGHIPTSANLPQMLTYLALKSDPAALESLHNTFSQLFGLAGLTGEEHAVVYEDAMDTAFGASCRGYLLLKYLGYPKVSILNGGYKAWVAQGFPTPTAVMNRAPQVFPAEPDTSWLATKEDVLRAIGERDTVLVDARDEPEWSGQSSSPIGKDYCPRKGRIPGARWLEWKRLFEHGDGIAVFKSSDVIRSLCASLGIDSDTPVITYCFGGVRAASVLVGMREAGIANVRTYLASWNEWSRDAALPVLAGP